MEKQLHLKKIGCSSCGAELIFDPGTQMTNCNFCGSKFEIEKAKDAYKKALVINPNSAEIYSNLGALSKDTEDWKTALTYLERAISIRPDLAEAHSNLGIVFQELGRL